MVTFWHLSLQSPSNYHPNFLRHKEFFRTFHSNLTISSQYLESEYQLDLPNFPEVLDQRRISFYYCYFVLMLALICLVFQWVQQALAFRASTTSHTAERKREKSLLSFKHKCDISLQLLKPELPLWVVLYFLKTAL